MNDSPLVSIVIPCYNQAQYLDDAIGSIRGSTYKNVEIIVIDDGPTEEQSVRILNSFRESGVRLVRQKNQGVCGARNRGIDEAHGDFVVMLDADDAIMPEFIEKAVLRMCSNSHIAAVAGLLPFGVVAKWPTNLYGQWIKWH